MSILQNLQRLRDRARGAGAGGHLLTGDALDEAHAGGRGGTLAPILRRYDDTPEAERLGGDHTHVSALIDCCPRAHALARALGPPMGQPPGSSMRVVWALGRAIEGHVRRATIAVLGMARVWGRWGCHCRETRLVGWGDPDARCPSCASPVAFYMEAALWDDEAEIVGSCDLPYLRDDGQLQVTEIKSITDGDSANAGGTGFSGMRAAQSAHRLQVGAYHRLFCALRERGGLPVPVHPKALVLYVRKEYQFKTPYREFAVDPAADRAGLDAMWETAREIAAARASGEVPPRLGACPSPSSSRARACPMAAACFAHRG